MSASGARFVTMTSRPSRNSGSRRRLALDATRYDGWRRADLEDLRPRLLGLTLASMPKDAHRRVAIAWIPAHTGQVSLAQLRGRGVGVTMVSWAPGSGGCLM